jgi:hypothetical protein
MFPRRVFLLKITACGSVISISNSSTTMPLWAIALIVERPALRAVTSPVD